MAQGKPEDLSIGTHGFRLKTRVDQRGQIFVVETYVDGAWLMEGDIYGMLLRVHRRDETPPGKPYADDPALSLW